MIMSAIDIVKRNGKNVSEDVIRRELSGNICRCTGYHNIVKAVQAGAANM
jgi:aerobic carbon-monoxide dehydrogenase small subunit